MYVILKGYERRKEKAMEHSVRTQVREAISKKYAERKYSIKLFRSADGD